MRGLSVVAVLLAACGSDDDAASSGGGSSSDATGSPATMGPMSTATSTSAATVGVGSGDASDSETGVDATSGAATTGGDTQCADGQARVVGSITPSRLFGPQMTGVIEPLLGAPVGFVVCFTLGDDLQPEDPLYA